MKPKILAILPGLIPSTLINVVTPLMAMHKAGQITANIELEIKVKDKDIQWSDLIVLCRNCEPMDARWFFKVLEQKKAYIYDIDDNLFELSGYSAVGKYHSAPQRIGMLEEYIRLASLVRVYSGPMLERARSINANSVRVNGPVDWRLLAPSPKKAEVNPRKIVYSTSRINDSLADIFKPALRQILEKYANGVRVYFLGYNPREFKIYPNVIFKPLNLNYEQYMRYFSGAGFDIGLAPLLDDVFHRSKTNLKYREYAACRIAGVYSDVDVYSTVVEHKKTGLVVKNDTEAWYRAISELVEENELRTQIQEQAYWFARENFSEEAFAQLWLKQINKLLNQPLSRNEYVDAMGRLVARLNQPVSFATIKSSHEFISGLHEMPGVFREIGVKAGLAKLASSVRAAALSTRLGRRYMHMISGIKSNGVGFLVSYARLNAQTAILLMKIKLTLRLFRK